jgi:purine-binding chemotaxis protein CheW
MADSAQQIRLITFVLGSESFVLDIMAVRQILSYTGSTPVPKAPAFVEGIIVLRNEVIPIIDLRQRLYPRLEPASNPLVLITRTSAGVLGLKVDQVRRMITIGVEEILPAPDIVRGVEGEFLIGVVPQGEGVFLLLDIETLLSSEEKTSLRETELVEQAAAGLE